MATLTDMTPITILVFDARHEDAHALARLIEASRLPVPFEVLPTSDSLKLESLLASEPDLLFIDVGSENAPHDGVNLARNLLSEGTRTRVIFTGDQSEAHKRIYQVDHLWYLPKPIDAQELHDALDKALSLIEGDLARPFMVHSGLDEILVRPSEIRYVESRLRILCIHEGNRDLEIYGNLGDIAMRLPHSFVRCHKSYLVNLDYVSGLDGHDLVLTSAEKIPVSQRRHTFVRKAMQAYFDR